MLTSFAILEILLKTQIVYPGDMEPSKAIMFSNFVTWNIIVDMHKLCILDTCNHVHKMRMLYSFATCTRNIVEDTNIVSKSWNLWNQNVLQFCHTRIIVRWGSTQIVYPGHMKLSEFIMMSSSTTLVEDINFVSWTHKIIRNHYVDQFNLVLETRVDGFGLMCYISRGFRSVSHQNRLA